MPGLVEVAVEAFPELNDHSDVTVAAARVRAGRLSGDEEPAATHDLLVIRPDVEVCADHVDVRR